MTMEKFKLRYCELIEHYQFIEVILEDIYAISKGTSYFQGLDEVESLSLSGIINALRAYDKKNDPDILTTEIYKTLNSIRTDRNFWAHNCFFVIQSKFKDNLEIIEDDAWIAKLNSDIEAAKEMRKKLYDIRLSLMEKKSLKRSEMQIPQLTENT